MATCGWEYEGEAWLPVVYGVRARDRLVICDLELVFVEGLLPDSSHGSCLLVAVHDLELARDVQLQYLPDATPSIQGYEIAGFYRAARAVGGDYYDFIPLANGRIALVLGDVCGKGAPAALTMVKLATETRAGAEICDSAAALVTRLNDRMRGHWITLVVIYVDPASHVFNIANAGHEYPLLRRANGYVEELTQDTGGTPLGETIGRFSQ